MNDAGRAGAVKLASGKIAAKIRGSGPTLVMFHSLLADRTSFERIEERLARRYRVAIPDLPGFGESAAVAGGLAAVADRMAEAIGGLGAEPPILLGNGYGGFVALQLAIRHPAAVARLILADTGAAFAGPGRAAFRAMIAAAETKGMAAIADTAMRRLFSPAYQAANPAVMAERRRRFLALDPAVFRGAAAALAALDLRAQLKSVRVPVLVLVGSEDEATPPAMAEELAAGLPDARLLILPGLAHVPQFQDPDAFLRAIAGFLPAGA